MIPIGNSLPGIIILVKTSAHIKNIDPIKAVIKIFFLWSVPNNILTICGIISPTNPIMPDEYTVSPITKDIIIKYKNNVLFIYINNSFDGSIIYEGDKIKTTKKDKENHGIGLNNVEKILKKYDGIMKVYHTEKRFHVDILMYGV